VTAGRLRGLTAAERRELAALVDRLAATLDAADAGDHMALARAVGHVGGAPAVLATVLREDLGYYPLDRRLTDLAAALPDSGEPRVTATAAVPPLLRPPEGGDWRQWAACARPGVDPELFFPEKGGTAAHAKRICAACPVKAPCLADALTTRDEHGVRGGTTPRERRRLRRRPR
jgi:Transcription factor WhiB